MADWSDEKLFTKTVEGGRIWMVTEHLKTRDKYGHDALYVSPMLVPVVEFYIAHIRPVFARFIARLPHFPPSHAVRPHSVLHRRCVRVCVQRSTFKGTVGRIDHTTGLFLTHSGHRYQNFEVFPKLCRLLFKKHINVKTLRKVVATEAAQKLSVSEVEAISKADTHSAVTVSRHYAKSDIKSNVLTAVMLLNKLSGQTDRITVPDRLPPAESKLIVTDCSDSAILELFGRFRRRSGENSQSTESETEESEAELSGSDSESQSELAPPTPERAGDRMQCDALWPFADVSSMCTHVRSCVRAVLVQLI